MAKTKEDYKKILEKLKEGGGNSRTKFDYLELQDSKNVVRVLPGHPNMDAFYVEKHQHQKGSGPTYMSVICLNHGDPRADECLIDSEDLEELRTSSNKDDKKKYSDWRAKPRYFLNVIDRSDDTVKTLACGPQILTGILGYITDDEEYGDILDPQEGRDLIIEKSGTGMDTNYEVKAKVKTSALFDDDDQIAELIGTSAEDTKLPDLTEVLKEFEGEPDNALFVWRNGWKAFMEKMKAEDSGDSKKASPKKDTGKGSKKVAPAEADEEPEAEDDDEVRVPLKSRCSVCGEKRFKDGKGKVNCPNNHGHVPQLAEDARPSKPSKGYLKEFPEPVAAEPVLTPLKSRCAVCGDKRFKAEDGTVSCKNGHGGPQLADGARPSKPSKAYLAEFPEPVEDEEEEEEPVPTKATAKASAKTVATPSKGASATKTSPSKPADDDDDEGLDDLDEILKKHTKK
jgi:hypothetical protein